MWEYDFIGRNGQAGQSEAPERGKGKQPHRMQIMPAAYGEISQQLPGLRSKERMDSSDDLQVR